MSREPNAPQYLSIEQAAEVLGCSTVTIRREIQRGNLKASRFARRILIDADDLKRALKPANPAGRRLAEAGGRVA